MRNEYLSDEELMKLIADVEDNSLIRAPKRLKSDVFSKIDEKKRKAKIVSMTTYRMKVCIAVAAAIGIFCTVPFKMPSSTDRYIAASEYREQKYTEYAKKQMKKDEFVTQWNEAKEEKIDLLEDFIESVNIKNIIGRIR